jgi:hypothetical protein
MVTAPGPRARIEGKESMSVKIQRTPARGQKITVVRAYECVCRYGSGVWNWAFELFDGVRPKRLDTF